MKGLFITGTDTDVGKTYVTTSLAQFLASQGTNLIVQKWIQTGKDRDVEHVPPSIPSQTVYHFSMPASPHLAADMAKKTIDPKKILDAYHKALANYDCVLVEGSGGILVPCSKQHFLIDIAKEALIPCLIVAENRVGTINHTILTWEACQKRGVPCVGILLNNRKTPPETQISQDHISILQHFTGLPVFGPLPWSKKPCFKTIKNTWEKIGIWTTG